MADRSVIPKDLRYTKDHEWVRLEEDVATVGITDHAQQALGEITYVDLPPAARQVKQSDELGAVESAKAAADVLAPVSGTVIEVNPALQDAPEKVNASPYDEGWICKLGKADVSDLDNLLTPAQYKELLEQEEA